MVFERIRELFERVIRLNIRRNAKEGREWSAKTLPARLKAMRTPLKR